MQNKIYAIAAPRQNKNGDILIRKVSFPNQDNQIVVEKKSVQIFIHFAQIDENGDLTPRYLSSEEREIMKSLNESILENMNISDTDVKPIWTTVSHIEIALDQNTVMEMIENIEDLTNTSQIRQYLSKLFPNCNVKKQTVVRLQQYLQNVQAEQQRPFDLYKVSTLIGRLAIIASIDTETGDSNVDGPLLITSHNPNTWKYVNWGEKNRRKFGTPVITQEVLNIINE